MAFEYHIDVARRLVHVVADGAIDFSQSLLLGETIPRDPSFRAGYSVLVDLREMDFDPEVEAAREFAEALPRLRPWYTGKIAVLTNPGFIHRLARFTAVIATSSGFPMVAFQSAAEAQAWIEKPESAA